MQDEDMMRLRLQCLTIAKGNIDDADRMVGYVLDKKEPELKPDDNTFSSALYHLKNGFAVSRAGWNGKGMWIKAQFPDVHSKMSLPYIYMFTADGQQVPWLASQTDMFAEDWSIVLPAEAEKQNG